MEKTLIVAVSGVAVILAATAFESFPIGIGWGAVAAIFLDFVMRE